MFQELSRQQRAFQTLEQEFVQTKARLTQELQQARNALRGPEAELDRVGSEPALPPQGPPPAGALLVLTQAALF